MMTDERAIKVLEIMKSQMNYFGATARYEGVKEMQEDAVDCALKALSEIQKYRAIGTVEECRAAVEKQRVKKPIEISPCKSVSYYECPSCGKYLSIDKPFCEECGKAIDWRDSQ